MMINNHYHCQCYHHELAPSFSSSSSSSSPLPTPTWSLCCLSLWSCWVGLPTVLVGLACSWNRWTATEDNLSEYRTLYFFHLWNTELIMISSVLERFCDLSAQHLERTWPSSLSMKYLSLQFFMCSPEMDKLSIDSYLEIDSIQVDAFNEDQ